MSWRTIEVNQKTGDITERVFGDALTFSDGSQVLTHSMNFMLYLAPTSCVDLGDDRMQTSENVIRGQGFFSINAHEGRKPIAFAFYDEDALKPSKKKTDYNL